MTDIIKLSDILILKSRPGSSSICSAINGLCRHHQNAITDEGAVHEALKGSFL